MSFSLPPLPYDFDALAPTISRATLETHHGKHHAAYVERLNALVAADRSLAGLSLEALIRTSGPGPVFNNAAQAWNHTFYWNSLTPGGGRPTGPLKSAIDRDFGSQGNFWAAFTGAATAHFASGWVWLVARPSGELAVVTTANAACPLTDGQTPLLVCDLWEHAYYLDHRSDRAAYVAAFRTLANWGFASDNHGR